MAGRERGEEGVGGGADHGPRQRGGLPARHASSASSPPRTTALLALPALLLAGCYSVGFTPAPGLSELAVPVFGNESLRRGLEHQLTRDVRRELLETTPIQLLAEEGEERPVLRGRISGVSEALLLTGPAQEVLESSVTVEVSFGVYRGGALLLGEDLDQDGHPDAEFRLSSWAEFDTTRGESRDTAAAEALRDLAEMIVFQLSAREDDRWEPNDTAGEARPLRLGHHAELIQRDEDWFSVTVPPERTLTATVFFSRGGLSLTACDGAGQPLPDAAPGDEGRLVRVTSGAAPRTVLLRIAGDEQGAPYQLRLTLVSAPLPLPDAPRAPERGGD